MENVKTSSGGIFSAIFQVFAAVTLWTLDKFETTWLSISQWSGRSGGEKLNLALDFLNGQRQEFMVQGSETHDGGVEETKRIKLLLDIDILPHEKYEIVSAENLCYRRSTPWIPVDWIIQMMSYYTLIIIKYVREYIEEIVHYLHPGAKEFHVRTLHALDNIEAEGRKIISPRKRLPKSNMRTVQRWVSQIMKSLGMPQKEGIVFEQFENIEGAADTSLNGSLNNSKLKASEKRKHPTSSSSESDSTEHTDEEVAYRSQGTPPPNNWTETQSNENHEIHEQSGEVTSSEVTSGATDSMQEQETDKNLDSSIDKDIPSTATNPTAAPSYFDVDEDYKSENDPDYVPPGLKETSSSEEISDAGEEDGATLVKELIQENKSNDGDLPPRRRTRNNKKK